jgi:Sugar-transfer associated ATP-grasp
VLLEDGAPAVFHALWKIPVGANPADNFWRPGNLLAALDADGCVTRVIQGTGADQTELDRHPDTEQPLIGAILPDWTALTGLCLKAAKALPGLRMQAWDIALTRPWPGAGRGQHRRRLQPAAAGPCHWPDGRALPDVSRPLRQRLRLTDEPKAHGAIDHIYRAEAASETLPRSGSTRTCRSFAALLRHSSTRRSSGAGPASRCKRRDW